MHLVHYDTKYDGVGDAKDHPNGIAVVGVMFQVSFELHGYRDYVVVFVLMFSVVSVFGIITEQTAAYFLVI